MNDEMPIIDMPEALNRSMGDVDFLKMMLEELHRSIPDYTARIKNSLQNKDMKTLGAEAHHFKGVAANLGAKAMAREALKLEQIGKSGAVENVDEALGRLEQAIAAFNKFYDEIDWAAIHSE